MSNRTQQYEDLKQKLRIIEKRFGFKYVIDWAYGKPRITNETGDRDISPRLSIQEMNIWLDGFIQAIEEEKRDGYLLDSKQINNPK